MSLGEAKGAGGFRELQHITGQPHSFTSKDPHFAVLLWPRRLKLGLMSKDDQELNFYDQVDLT